MFHLKRGGLAALAAASSPENRHAHQGSPSHCTKERRIAAKSHVRGGWFSLVCAYIKGLPMISPAQKNDPIRTPLPALHCEAVAAEYSPSSFRGDLS
jgi:hypothetical protein